MGRTFAAAFALALLAGAPAAFADDPPDAGGGGGSGADDAPDAQAPIVKDPKVAKKWLTAAQQLLAKGDAAARRGKADEAATDYDNAALAYGKALEAGADGSVAFALAQLDDKRNNLPEAIKNYKLVIAAGKSVPAALAKQASNKLDADSGKVGLLTLAVTPDGARISINGAVVGTAPLPEPLVLMPGAYKLSIEADGYQSKADVELSVEAGSEAERKFELEAATVAVHSKHEEAYVPPPPAKPHHPSKLPMYLGGGVAVVGLGFGIGLGLHAKHEHDIFVAPNTSPNSRLDAQDFGRQYAHAADACFGGAVVGALFAGGWYLFHWRKTYVTDRPDESPDSPKLTVAPWVSPSTGGLAAMGSF